MLTAQGDPASRIVGLELGADDYLPKPFEPRELVARINAVLRRAGGATPAAPAPQAADGVRALQRLGVRPAAPPRWCRRRRWWWPCRTPSSACSSAFVDHPRRVLSRERLLDLSRAPGVEVTDRSIDLAVSRLRQKLGDTPRGPARGR